MSEAAFLDLLDSTLRVSTRTTHNNYGEPAFAASTATYRARLVERPGLLRDGDDEGAAYSHIAWVASTGGTSITVTDRVTLPGGIVRPLLRVERYPDESGPHHVVVYFGY